MHVVSEKREREREKARKEKTKCKPESVRIRNRLRREREVEWTAKEREREQLQGRQNWRLKCRQVHLGHPDAELSVWEAEWPAESSHHETLSQNGLQADQ